MKTNQPNFELLDKAHAFLNLNRKRLDLDNIRCGSIGCAMGLLPDSPDFKALGFGFASKSDVDNPHGVYYTFSFAGEDDMEYDEVAGALFNLTPVETALFGTLNGDEEVDVENGLSQFTVWEERYNSLRDDYGLPYVQLVAPEA